MRPFGPSKFWRKTQSMDVGHFPASHRVEATSDIAIVVCADQKFFPPAYALCHSLSRSPSRAYDVQLFTEDGPHLNVVPHDVAFKILTPDFIGRIPKIDTVRMAPFGFLRLFVPEMLEGYRRILYLDCDIRIDGSIAPILEVDLKGAAFAAADDVMTYCVPGLPAGVRHPRINNLDFQPDWSYFNSGVMLIDCEQWRRTGMTGEVIDCMARLGSSKKFIDDQDALNLAFRTRWVALSPRWNFPTLAFATDIEAIIKPVVYHHTYYKPWIFGRAIRRERRKFQKAMRETPYKVFEEKASFHQVKRLVEAHAKKIIQNATFFLPSSRQRLEARSPKSIARRVAAEIVRSIREHRYIDEDISAMDVSALLRLLGDGAVRNR
jgi:lipopolysaccharide biosynthesis glycosyltransferase